MRPRILLNPDPPSNEQGGTTTVDDTSDAPGGIPGTDNSQVELDENGKPIEAADDTDATTDDATTDEPRETGLTREDITAILQEVIPSTQAQPRTEDTRQWSQEEIDRHFNVWKPDEGLITRLRSEDPKEALQAFYAIRDGLIRQAMTMAEIRIQQITGDMRTNEIAPISTYVSEARATALRNEFFTSNKDLEPYDAIVDAVSARMHQNGATFAGDKKKMFSEMAKQSRAVVKQLLAKNGNGTPSTNGKPKGKMSSVSPGGQGGGGAAGKGKTTNVPKGVADGLAVFNED